MRTGAEPPLPPGGDRVVGRSPGGEAARAQSTGVQSAAGRVMLLVAHTGRPAALRVARVLFAQLAAAGIGVRVLEPEAAELGCDAAAVVPASSSAAAGTEMVLVVGGDGTLLRAAELARPAGVPLLGVNLGHVGFLAEAEPEDLAAAVANIAAHRYSVEERMTIEVAVRVNGGQIAATWALNEATVEKAARERMLDLVIEVDGRPLSRWGCDGVVFATPTGSTAYAFSAGGPVVWPEVEALLMVPISAHALFAGPMVVSPRSVLAAEVIGAAGGQQVTELAVPGSVGTVEQFVPVQSGTAGAVLWCDGRRMVELPPGSRIEVRRGSLPVLLARLPAVAGAARATGRRGSADGPEVRIGAPFTDRLVAKFGLPIAGWRGRPADRTESVEAGTVESAKDETGRDEVAAAEAMAAGTAVGENGLARDEVAEVTDEESGGHA
ncbi:MAG TPA: NAD kinase [Streptosporangiaceae bacterium]|nr:NAD kinase [Streptosporangiaceae bacterium]